MCDYLRRVSTVVAAAALLVTLTACGTKDDTNHGAAPTTQSQEREPAATEQEGNAPVGDFAQLVMPHPDDFTCEQYGELARELTEGMYYAGDYSVEPSGVNVGLLRCYWKSEPDVERVMNSATDLEIWIRSNDSDSQSIWRMVQAGEKKVPEKYVRWESQLVESLGGLVFGEPFEKNGGQLIAELPGVSVDVHHECEGKVGENFEDSEGNCTNAPAAYTSENAVKALEQIVAAIAESS